MIVPEPIEETPAQKAARRKHARRALDLLLEAAGRMEKARLPLVMVTGSIGEAWAVAEFGMLPTDNAKAPWDGWLPDGRTVDVKCRYLLKSGGHLRLSPGKATLIDMLFAVQITAEKRIERVYLGSYRAALAAGSQLAGGKVSVSWSRLAELHNGDPV